VGSCKVLVVLLPSHDFAVYLVVLLPSHGFCCLLSPLVLVLGMLFRHSSDCGKTECCCIGCRNSNVYLCGICNVIYAVAPHLEI